MKHYSVLLNESIEGLNLKDDGVYIDATVGYAGHSKEILSRVKRGFLFAFDQDLDAIEYSNKELSGIGHNYKLIHKNFSYLKSELKKLNVDGVDGILFDLGLSSPQIDDTSRGFSFMNDATLDMRMNKEGTITAKKIINEYSVDDLTQIFYQYGEESMAKVIAKKIVEERKNKIINTTKELVEVISKAVGAKYFYKNHPERQIFQAIRIEVNDEIKILETILPDTISLLKPGGRICIITFHSLEDRIVKQFFKKYSEINDLVKGLPENEIPDEYKPKLKIINKKPILPSDEEIKVNSRSKSAKLRIAERI